MTQPEFLYFDLGKVLVDFNVERMFRQMGEVAGIEPGRVEAAVFADGLQRQYELGQISAREFYEAFCRKTGTRPDYESLEQAGSDIFKLIPSMLPVVTQLGQAGYRMGILSNTCESHWEHCTRRFRIIAEAFCVHVLSCRIGAAKPDAAIFRAAAEMAGCRPQEIFFVDDLPDHVAGARAVGFDAVQYTSTPELVAELCRRGLRFNY
jgi:HAD superfamily hydrolase (TIGR01509 family)